jgi:5-methyltetrahydrofolate--homocysteine methyltransferase
MAEVRVRGLVEGGVDSLMVETVFDNELQGSPVCHRRLFRAHMACTFRVMVSGTITDCQWPHPFRPDHRSILELGLACASVFGSTQLRWCQGPAPYIEELAKVADVNTSLHPMPGCPMRSGEYDESAGIYGVIPQGIAEAGF